MPGPTLSIIRCSCHDARRYTKKYRLCAAAQLGMTAAWIITLCRVVQGFAAMGEITGAQLYLTEAIKPPTQYPAVGLINCAGDLGATTALGIAAFTTATGFSWRIAFFVGAGVALIRHNGQNCLARNPYLC